MAGDGRARARVRAFDVDSRLGPEQAPSEHEPPLVGAEVELEAASPAQGLELALAVQGPGRAAARSRVEAASSKRSAAARAFIRCSRGLSSTDGSRVKPSTTTVTMSR